LKALRAKINGLENQIADLGISPTFIASENPAVSHPQATIRIRGVFTDKADPVPAGVPGFLGALPKDGPQNRSAWPVARRPRQSAHRRGYG
jgi:hypothetical protein